ncbi:hypothetical protein [Sediminibacterium soli]|uniref:hypothetical protein n=1 Tax=Sediminibacterium soli TaxID=2698829 RepID=UPI00137A3029|nr:hypothetical protein [Sediminibacterium soli]NCI47764.1 hypothetical protein [Sediminibacterium soli]
MKTQNTDFYQALGRVQLENLAKEVKETVAANSPAIHHKNSFGVVELWHMAGSRRNRIARRHTGMHTDLL